MLLTFHFDPVCPWTWVTSRWLLRAAGPEGLEVRWAPFSLAHVNEGTETADDHQERFVASRLTTRVVQRLLDLDDNDAVGRFYDCWGDRVHRHGEEPTRRVVLDVAAEVGLADDVIAAADDESLDAAVDAATDDAVAAAGPDIGSPVLRWHDGPEEVAVFGPILDAVPDEAASADLWRGIALAARTPSLKELKRGREGGPDLAAA